MLSKYKTQRPRCEYFHVLFVCVLGIIQLAMFYFPSRLIRFGA